jgi:hypothetical protein
MLTFDHVLAVAGLVVGVIGLFVGVRSDRKMKAAQEAKREIESKFMNYLAAQEFQKLALETVSIMSKIRSREWDLVEKLAHSIAPALGQARGARSRLLGQLEKDKLDGAAVDIQRFLDSLPLSNRDVVVSDDQIQRMLYRCRSLVDVASEIAGRLGVESMQLPREQA